jgi:hypothetical protein
MKNIQYVLFVAILSVFILGATSVMADQCTGQNCNANVTVNIGNIGPVITSVWGDTPVTLTGLGYVSHNLYFNVSDSNGIGDIDPSSIDLTLTGSNAVIHFGNLNTQPCVQTNVSATSQTYSCNYSMDYWYSAGNWVSTVTIKDKELVGDTKNGVFNVTVNALDYVTQNTASVSWSGVVVGVNNTEALNPIVLENGGNQNYANISVKGYNATGTTNFQVIKAIRFSIGNATGMTTGKTYMSENNFVSISTLSGLNTHGEVITQSVFFYLNVDNGLSADTYVQDNTWSIKVA